LNNAICHLAPKSRRRSNSEELARWWNDGGDARLRFNYPLTERSIVLDLGGYRGQWASDLYSRYRCPIAIFEPIASYADAIRERFRLNRDITVHQFGLGGCTRTEKLSLSEDATSQFRSEGPVEDVNIRDAAEWIAEESVSSIDLIKINIEGGEYELLERLLETGLVQRIDNIQVQFHDLFPEAAARMDRILAELMKTHVATYQYRFVWENWSRRR